MSQMLSNFIAETYMYWFWIKVIL